MEDLSDRYPYGFRIERTRRILADGTEKVYEVKRPRGPGRQKKDVTKKELRELISRLSDVQLVHAADFIKRLAMGPSPTPPEELQETVEALDEETSV